MYKCRGNYYKAKCVPTGASGRCSLHCTHTHCLVPSSCRLEFPSSTAFPTIASPSVQPGDQPSLQGQGTGCRGSQQSSSRLTSQLGILGILRALHFHWVLTHSRPQKCPQTPRCPRSSKPEGLPVSQAIQKPAFLPKKPAFSNCIYTCHIFQLQPIFKHIRNM